MGTGVNITRPSWARLRGPDEEEAGRKDDMGATNPQFETEINGVITERLREYNNRDVDSINEHLDSILEVLKDERGESFEKILGGSVKKHTYVEGLSDVDTLLIIDESKLSDYTPETVKRHVSEILKDRLSGISEIKVGSMCVTVNFNDGCKVQLLPAMRKKAGVVIQEQGKNSWSSIVHPERFANKLSSVNKNCNNKIVPIIKIFKGINATFPPEKQLCGYHIESMAIEAFKNYNPDGRNYKNMIEFFCERSCEIVMSPIKDKTGQSYHVDDYLGTSNSAARSKCRDALQDTLRKMKHANINCREDEWVALLGGAY